MPGSFPAFSARFATIRASRITNLSAGNDRSSFRPKFNLRIRRAAKMRAPRISACERRTLREYRPSQWKYP